MNTEPIDHAAVLYGGAPEQHEAKSDAPASSHAETLYGQPTPYPGDDGAPQAVQDLRAADRSRAMYSPQNTHRFSIPDGAFGADVDVRAIREVAADLAVEPDQAATLRVLHGQVERGEADPNAWVEQSLKLIETEGYTDHELSGAWALIQRDPRVHAYLSSGLAAHPDVVRHFVRLARQTRR